MSIGKTAYAEEFLIVRLRMLLDAAELSRVNGERPVSQVKELATLAKEWHEHLCAEASAR